MSTEWKVCINCKHYRNKPPFPFPSIFDPYCGHPENIIRTPPINLVTGKPKYPELKLHITNLEIMREGGGYCGEKGIWYEVRSLPEMIQQTTGETE
jgi:hypothetical protein